MSTTGLFSPSNEHNIFHVHADRQQKKQIEPERAVFGEAIACRHHESDCFATTDQRFILVIDRALHAAERIDASKFEHEAMQIPSELDRAVPRLKRERG
jgi:hypothetical protein